VARTSERAKLAVSAEQSRMLLDTAQSRTALARAVRRARILRCYLAGESFTTIARRMGVARRIVYHCVDKALAMGVEAALKDLPRPGHEPAITAEDKTWVQHLACTKPKELGYAAELWTRSALANHVRQVAVAAGHPALAQAGKATVHRILTEAQLQPIAARGGLPRSSRTFRRSSQTSCNRAQVGAGKWRSSATRSPASLLCVRCGARFPAGLRDGS